MYEAFSAKFVRNVDANRTIKDELTAAIRAQGARRRISVTDLVNPRQAFFRRTRPDIQPSAERAQTMMTGTGVHAQFERTISTEEFAEQFVTYEDIVGKIDIYEDAPVELKTTSFQDRDGVVRPSYLDQLGMYCAMTGIPRGHLVVYYTPRSGDGAVLSAYAVELSNLAEIRTGMIRRRDLFQRALDAGTPSGLPQCEWYGRRCDYQDVCGCEAAPPLERVVRADMATVTRDPGLEDQINEKLRRSGARPTGYRIHHLLFPRKTAYRQQPDAVVEEDESSEARLTSSFPGRRRTDSNPMRSSRRMNRARPGSRRSGGAVSTRRSPRRCNTDSREDSGVSLSGCGPWLIASPCSGGSQRWSARLVSGA